MDAQQRLYLLNQVEAMEDTIITAAIAAPIINTDPQTLRYQARFRPEMLGFPVTVIGKRVKIPRLPFIKYVKGQA